MSTSSPKTRSYTAANTMLLTTAQNGALERILAFSFDDEAAAYPFTARLARENDWARDYAERAIAEYRRFMFLTVAAGHPVTPSDQVDQVWHLHLLHTRSYWDRFCGETLGRRLDHDPTKGGQQERNKFENWYERTLESYRKIFGDPPPDIWPPSAVRFGDDLHYVRVNRKRNWIIPMTRLTILCEAVMGVALVLLLVVASRIL